MRRVHLIGICGTAMATLAVLLRQRGVDVVGSDEQVYPPMSDLLRDHGIIARAGYREEHIGSDLDLVVIGNAVSRGNPEVEAVLDRKIRHVSLPEMVRNEFLWDTRTAVVCGTHGKTTTAFMLAWMLRASGGDPSFLVGGISHNLGTSGHLGTDGRFVIEGDEYDSAFFDKTAKFLKYLPDVVVVNNLEFDHADIYRDLDELRLSFRRLIRLIPRHGRLIVNADDAETLALAVDAPCPVDTFGLSPAADWQARHVTFETGRTRFEAVRRGAPATAVVMPVAGSFNVRNALGALAAAAALGTPAEDAAPTLDRFAGVKRRLELRGRANGVSVYDDFAHHPTAVRETLAAVRTGLSGGRLWAIFEPRSATACRRVFQTAFGEAFGEADEVVVAAVHRRELPDAERLSEVELVEDVRRHGGSARFVPSVEAIVETVAAEVSPGDRVVIMSNGGFGGIHDKLLTRLSGVAPETDRVAE